MYCKHVASMTRELFFLRTAHHLLVHDLVRNIKKHVIALFFLQEVDSNLLAHDSHMYGSSCVNISGSSFPCAASSAIVEPSHSSGEKQGL